MRQVLVFRSRRNDKSIVYFIMKIIIVSYLYKQGYKSAEAWIKLIRPLHEVMSALSETYEVIYLAQIDYMGELRHEGVRYVFLQSSGRRTRFPVVIHRLLKKEKPDVVIVPGFHFPIQLLQLRWYAGMKPLILVRHHGDRPPKGIRRFLVRIADRCVDGYLFTSMGNASEWVDAGIIARKKIHETLSGSTRFLRADKEASRKSTGMCHVTNFLWVGRLEQNKDPMTVIRAMIQFFEKEPAARLYMIFQEKQLLVEVQHQIALAGMNKRIILVGNVSYSELQHWYSAADYYISGSHREAQGYSLSEAMACGCVPIVTEIPPAMKVIDDGRLGYYYPAGNVEALVSLLSSLDQRKREVLSAKIEKHFREQLSPAAIAGRIISICYLLKAPGEN
jgi:glycosyltransferase involved in cell wall biosynthesis